MIGDDIVSDVGGAQRCSLAGVLVRTGKYRYDSRCKLCWTNQWAVEGSLERKDHPNHNIVNTLFQSDIAADFSTCAFVFDKMCRPDDEKHATVTPDLIVDNLAQFVDLLNPALRS